MKEFKLPDIGEGITQVTVTDILTSNNKKNKANETIIIVESEKASMEIPADEDFTTKRILVKIGDIILPGDPIIEIKSDLKEETTIKEESTVKKESSIKENHTDSPSVPIDIPTNIHVAKNNNIYASPSVRKLARQLDCDLKSVIGTGKNGRITAQDVHNSISGIQDNKTSKNIDNIFEKSSNWGLTEKIKLSSIKQKTGERLHKSWVSIPHVTQFDECDITKLDKIRIILSQKNNNPKIKVSFIPFFVKAIVKILKKLTIFNTSLSDDSKFLLQKNYWNIGIAVNTKRGLVVPVIKDADKKSIKKISEELTLLINKSKNKKLTIKDMSGGCFTISSLGGISGKFFTPIINPPEVAILGISNIYIKPILINNKFKARKILPISLSYDHRVIDGVDAANFTKLFSKYISNPTSLIDE